MPRSLVEALAEAGQRRPFYLPLATASPEFSSVRPVGQDQFDPERDNTIADDPTLRIVITPQTGGQFTDEGSLPDPAIRLHAIGASLVRFKPANATHADRLEIRIIPFFTSILTEFRGGYVFPAWWERWREAGCIPARVVYENIDIAVLRQHLENVVRAPVDDQFENRVLATHGLRFPLQVLESTKSEFIDLFFSGDDAYFLEAESGAYLGTVAAVNPATATGDSRLLILHAEYHDHTDSVPHAMNPLELFYLLFGDDSDEAQHHPLLRKIDATGRAQAALESKTMRLRPPLRTHDRVIWEADLEIANHPDNWGKDHNCSSRFYNDHSRENRQFDHTFGYVSWNKCNLFASDIALRSGFRVNIIEVGNGTALNPGMLWHYTDANSYTTRVHNTAVGTDRVPIVGTVEGASRTWAWKIEGWLRSLPVGDRVRALNDAMNVEGRCLILAGSRTQMGHIIIVQSVNSLPDLLEIQGAGLNKINITTREALDAFADERTIEFGIGGSGGTPTYSHNFIRLHLFELHPGEDPDSPRGLKDCNVRA